MKLNTIIKFLNKELKVSKIKDSSKNGLQVKGKNEVTKIAFGVDACMELFEKAKTNKCDLVIVHHGILWKPQKREERGHLRPLPCVFPGSNNPRPGGA